MEVLEVDPHMLEMAEMWFWFRQDERMRVHIADGVEFMKQSVGEGKKGQLLLVASKMDNLMLQLNHLLLDNRFSLGGIHLDVNSIENTLLCVRDV